MPTQPIADAVERSFEYLAEHDISFLFEGISLALTSPTVWLAIGVVCLWGLDAFKVAKEPGPCRRPHDWLVLGVAVSFIGSTGDNIYWALAWTAELNNSSWRDFLFAYGAFPNIFFRQACGIYAAHCHIMAYITTKETSALERPYKMAAGISLLAGITWVLLSFLLS